MKFFNIYLKNGCIVDFKSINLEINFNSNSIGIESIIPIDPVDSCYKTLLYVDPREIIAITEEAA